MKWCWKPTDKSIYGHGITYYNPPPPKWGNPKHDKDMILMCHSNRWSPPPPPGQFHFFFTFLVNSRGCGDIVMWNALGAGILKCEFPGVGTYLQWTPGVPRGGCGRPWIWMAHKGFVCFYSSVGVWSFFSKCHFFFAPPQVSPQKFLSPLTSPTTPLLNC